MKILKNVAKAAAILIAIKSTMVAGVYIVPQNYDDMYLSNQSEAYALIKQDTSDLSGNKYTIGGEGVKYRCIKVPKIKCGASAPEVISSVSEVSLRHPSTTQIVQTFSYDLRVEDDADDWYLCGAAYGGMVYDNSTLTQSKNESNETILTYTYEPNTKSETYLYFTDKANASDTSYMSIRYKQVCR